MKHKYKLKDVDCNFCIKKGNRNCDYGLCSYIMSNLTELFADSKFREAVKNSEYCNSFHKNTLQHLAKQARSRGYDLFDDDKSFCYEFRPECKSCAYASPGFVCYSKSDGTCLKDWIRSTHYAGR